MIIGAHSIIYSKSPDRDRAFLRDVLMLANVDVGEGGLVFGLPPVEVTVHPSNKSGVHEFYHTCDGVEALIAALNQHNITCGPVQNQSWGLLTKVTLPAAAVSEPISRGARGRTP